MSLKCGIVGLPNVGKSTLFNCVSSGRAQSANFPFCTIEPNLGSTNVPDKRLEALADLCKPQRVIPATVDIVDIAGLVKGASKGEGLGNQFLANIRETDAILHVLRCFDDGNIVHVDGSVDPVRDKEVVDAELQIKDLETVENRLAKASKQAKTGGDKDAKKLVDLLERYREALLAGKSCRTVELSAEEEGMAKDLFLLTNKPVMYICNVDDKSAVNGNAYVDAVREAVKEENAEILVGTELTIDDRKFVVDSVNTDFNKVSLKDITFQNSTGFPIFRSESIDFVKSIIAEQAKPQLTAEFQKAKPQKVQNIVVYPEIPISERHNFQISNDELGYGTPKEKFRRNVEAVNLLHELEFDHRLATPEEQEILSQYVG